MLLVDRDTELTPQVQREESGESQFQGSLWRATLSGYMVCGVWSAISARAPSRSPPGASWKRTLESEFVAAYGGGVAGKLR